MELKELAVKLAQSEKPEIRWKILVNVFEESIDSKRIISLSQAIKKSSISTSLLQNQNENGEIVSPRSVYDKWQGAHWIFASLADIGYPRGDSSLLLSRDQLLDHWLDEEFFQEFVANSKVEARKKLGVPIMDGRYRRCASQQGYCLFYLLRLGIEDHRVEDLAERLMHWQWPDGGWNCDKTPSAHVSTFTHTAIALRGLAEYNKKKKSTDVTQAIDRAAEVFLRRGLFRRLTDNSVIREEFTKIHYPLYWHYDVLGMLKILSESGHIKDKRCDEAIELVMSRYIDGEGWPAERKYYKTSSEFQRGNDYADWGGTGGKKANPWVTADVLYVLKSKGLFAV